MNVLWPVVQTGDSMEFFCSEACNCGNCPVNQRMRTMTMVGYLDELSVPTVVIMNTYLNWCQGCKCTNRVSTVPVSPRTYTHWISAPSYQLEKKPQWNVMKTHQLYMPQFLEAMNQEKKKKVKSKFYCHKLYPGATTLKLIFQKGEF